MERPWTQSWSGAKLHLPTADHRPDLSAVPIYDLIFQMAGVNRWGGGTASLINLAHHSVVVSDFVQELGGSVEARLYALFHDTHELWLGDWSYVVVRSAPPEVQAWRRWFTESLDTEIYRKVGLGPITKKIAQLVSHADRRASAWEARDNLAPGGPQSEWLSDFPAPPEVPHVPMDREESIYLFAERLGELRPNLTPFELMGIAD
jgi:hypothetical protein